jgi:hypothetical protein
MGFLGPVPAAQVTAMYFVEKRQLHLQAACTVPCVTTGIKFERLGFSGGLKLVLEGWSGPLTGRTEHYDVECSFDIQLPNRATPSGTVIVETANHPNGIEVPIRFDGLIIPPTTTPDSAPAAPTKSDVPVIAKKPVIPAPPNYHVSDDEKSTLCGRNPSPSSSWHALQTADMSSLSSMTNSSSCYQRPLWAQTSSGRSISSRWASLR